MTVQVRSDRDAALAAGHAFLDARVAASNHAGEAYFERYAYDIAACAAAMADRFFAGATLLVFGAGPHATDAQHNSVEFVHPVLPGCRALPALSLTNDLATVTGMLQSDAAEDVYAHQVRVLGRSGDIALAFAHAPRASVDLARTRRRLQRQACSPSHSRRAMARQWTCRQTSRFHVAGERPERRARAASGDVSHALGAGPHRAQPPWDRRGLMSTECHDEVCITCSDQLLEVSGYWRWMHDSGVAHGTVDGSTVEVGIDLLDGVTVGDVLLCHGGVALQRGTPVEVSA